MNGLQKEAALEFLDRLAAGVAQMFGPSCEVVIHDMNNKESSIVSIYHGEVTKRQVGDSLSILGVQKLDALTHMSRQSLGNMIAILGRAENLPVNATDNGEYACSELIVAAFKAIGIPLSQASGFTPGDMVRLSQAGFLSAVGRLQVPAK